MGGTSSALVVALGLAVVANSVQAWVRGTRMLSLRGRASVFAPDVTTVLRNAHSPAFQYVDKKGDSHAYPFIREPMWYRISVRKGSELTVCDLLMQCANTPGHDFNGIIYDACSPQAEMLYYPSVKVGTPLAVRSRAAVAGLVYVKTLMNPSIGHAIESVSTVRWMSRNEDGFVMPLERPDVAELESFFDRKPVIEIDSQTRLLTKGSFVAIATGGYAGNYGVIIGTKDGLMTVKLIINRSEFIEYFEAQQLLHLPQAPERPLEELSPWELLEEAAEIDPHNPLVRRLARQSSGEYL